jgi:hypothetical protein
VAASKRKYGDFGRQDIRAAREPCVRLLRCDRLGRLGEGNILKDEDDHAVVSGIDATETLEVSA